ncbi:Oxoglutarate/iron-dependent dioxygenase [Trema orientale]|uniref:Oxoglutarate/iron-dependent dioxygenase n=1 Tax=Trema orientale TaxID=63057 RepID=A0A2P5EV90_TREOI|nr:Oxoglutarate/iron-dependent dioxygenase [Trema orientale]
MGSLTEPKIPVVYFNKETLNPGTDSWALACKQVRHAFEEYGCFEAVYDKVPVQVHNSVFAATKDLFDLPTETLMRKTTDRPGLPYTPNWVYNPLFESLGIDYPSNHEEVEHFTSVMWPQGNEGFRESVLSFSELIVELYETATRMIFEGFGVERLHDSIMKSTFPRIKFAKYRKPKEDEANLGLRIHTDKTFITIVHQHEVEGLEIKYSKDGQWLVDAKPSPTSFVVFAGDAFMAWSNDRVIPCEHRVVMKEGKDRYAISLFTYIEGIMDIPEEMVDDEYPLRYKPINHLNFMKRYFVDEEPGLQYSPCAIRTFCGV